MTKPLTVRWPYWAAALVAVGIAVTIAAMLYDVFAT